MVGAGAGMVRGLLLAGSLALLPPGARAHPLVPGGALPETGLRRVWAPACGGLERGQVVRSARPVKDGSGTERRRFWRGHYRVVAVLAGGRFLAEPLYRRDDTSGEIDRGTFAPFPGEAAHGPSGVLICEAFVTE